MCQAVKPTWVDVARMLRDSGYDSFNGKNYTYIIYMDRNKKDIFPHNSGV